MPKISWWSCPSKKADNVMVGLLPHLVIRLYNETSQKATPQCVLCKVRCHCIFSGPSIGYSDIFCVPGIMRYSVIIKLPCALLQIGHLETVHAPVADTVAYFADLDAPVVDTVTYFGGNHRSRVWRSLKLKKVFFPRTRTSWDKYMFNRIVFFKF